MHSISFLRADVSTTGRGEPPADQLRPRVCLDASGLNLVPSHRYEAAQLINRAGARLVCGDCWPADGQYAILVPPANDDADFRGALRTLQLDRLPVVPRREPLDAIRHKTHCRGPAKPQCLEPARPERGVSYAESTAMMLNRLFLEQGARGEPGRFTAEAVERAMEVRQQTRRKRSR